ncbi:CRISPR-associated helicase Cas3' [Caloramator sp. E03]|uniref:CRISPR-associated helicase Cas3' n=1 Tax=Caloramator sp. E03 TaxID=2576307 RepID=UPI0011109071|nr:CRISPR-associated helicase Cas3' [Caloramator sp. E03]QCX34105.1 CRISPR-associated helicase Cas3' [Caloramator sp. E03]
MKFFSHPDKELILHLREVYEINKDKVDKDLREYYRIISYCHDFGKFTSYFQRYLKTKKRGKYTDHGFISALFAAFCAFKEYGEDNIVLLIYSIVLHHHGDLENASKDLPSSISGLLENDYRLLEKIEIAQYQINDMIKNKNYIKEEYRKIDFDIYVDEFLDSDITFILKKLKKLSFLMEKSPTEKNYFVHQILYSSLISADKLSASQIDIPTEKYAQYECLDRVRLKIIGNSFSTINEIRREIFYKVQKSIERDYKKSRFFTITAPTGTGKTYTGFFAALKLRELLGGNRRIIYCLPFTSIIDQNYDVLYDLHNEIEEFKEESSRFLIKHHSLSNVEYKSEEYEYDNLDSELLIENWSSGIIVTTFVQLLETLISCRNRMLKKLINLKGSILILDEIQAIDISFLPLVDYVLRKSSEYFNLHIIMMTATKPYILNEAIELLDDCTKYFSIFNRTKLIINPNNIKLEEFIMEFKNNIEDKSYLIVCNTISSSLKVYNSLKDLKRKIYYLSTNLLPIHRKRMISEIKECLDKKEKIILVSTQVVEAGVNFDFDIAIRDIGPIDSIIQCAGRCNRNGNKDLGNVKVYSLIDDDKDRDGFGFSKYVYGIPAIRITKEILGKESIEEKEYYNIVSEYFKRMQDNKSKDKSMFFKNSILSLNFSNEDNNKIPIYKFSLIENNLGYFDVLLLYDDIVEDAFDKYCKLRNEKDYYERRRQYLKIKNILKDYTLSLPIKYNNIFEEKFGFYILPRHGIKDYYDEKTGFIRDAKSFDIF